MNDKANAQPTDPLNRLAAEIESGDMVRATQTFEALPPGVKARPRAQVLLAATYLKIGELERARQALQAAETGVPMGLTAKIERAAVLAKLGDQSAYHAALLEICAARPKSLSHLVQLCQSHLARGEMDESVLTLDRIERLGRAPAEVRQLRYRIALARLDTRGMVDALDSIILHDDALPRLPQLMVTLRELPEPDRSRLYAALQRKWPDTQKKLAAWGDNAHAPTLSVRDKRSDLWAGAPACVPTPDRFRRPLITDDGTELIESAKGGSGLTLLVFSGFADRAMAPIEWVDAFCAAGDHSAIYLRDFGRTLYMNGIPALGDNMAEACDSLTRLLAAHGTRRLLCLGTSAGGFGAIRYGLRLNAERILAASPPISFRVVDELGDSRARLFVQRMYAMFGKEEDLDLSRDVAIAGGRAALDVWYGEASQMDAAHARMLEGLPGVTLHPLAGVSDHNVFPDVISNGAFEAFLNG